MSKAGDKDNGTGVDQASEKPKKLLNGGVDPSIGKATQFKPGQSGNPEGRKPGKNLATWINQLMNDESFEVFLFHPREGYVPAEKEQPPIQAIVKTAIYKAAAGDEKSREWLAKYGYGTKVEVTGADGEPLMPVVRIIDERPTTRDTDTK